MNYSSIRKMDVSNGTGVGVSLFVSGCPFHCNGCFNESTWEYDSGHEFTKEVEDKFISLASRPYINRISILGGEPLADKNFDAVLELVEHIRTTFGDSKEIWLYTGRTYEDICKHKYAKVLPLIDVLVDGRFEESKKDPSLLFRGSSNQRLIDMNDTIKTGSVKCLKIDNAVN